MATISKTVKNIKSLKIQGASKVREKALEALVDSVEKTKVKTAKQFRKEFLGNCKKLFNARPTEPELRTAIRILKKSISNKELTLGEMREKILKTADKYENSRTDAMKKMASYGSKMIKKNSVVLTLCHSHSVVNTLIKAKSRIKKVYCCETRPRYQGRMTARDLAKAGIDVILIVDNAASTVLKECDYFFTGADAFFGDGDVINKIGTNQISHVAKNYETKHYVVCSTHKFEPSSFFGKDTPIEQRNKKEVLPKNIPKVNVMNPAFDRTDSSFIEGIICEKGIFPPEVLASKIYSELDLEKHEKNFLKL
jgi:ribose 1,5-bisphosphate isomerase